MEELPIAEPSACIREAAGTAVRRLIELTSHQQQTQRTMLAWLRVEYRIEKPSNKLLARTELDSTTWVSEVKRIRGKKHPLSSAGLHALRDEYTRTIDPPAPSPPKPWPWSAPSTTSSTKPTPSRRRRSP